ncbi:17890_t:CDS:2, partial [Racocetra persica]
MTNEDIVDGYKFFLGIEDLPSSYLIAVAIRDPDKYNLLACRLAQ